MVLFSLAARPTVVAAVLLANTGSEVEKWIAPILTSALSLAAAYFGYLTGRDKLAFDVDMRLCKASNETLKADVIEEKATAAALKIEAAALRSENEKLRTEVLTVRHENSTLVTRLNERDEARMRKKPRKPDGSDPHPPLGPPDKRGS